MLNERGLMKNEVGEDRSMVTKGVGGRVDGLDDRWVTAGGMIEGE
jgi:hypothetical protein